MFFSLTPAEILYNGPDMPDFAPSVTRLIDELKHLPGIGQKTAQRLAFHLLRTDRERAFALSDAIREAKEKIRECSICNNITDSRSMPFLLRRQRATDRSSASSKKPQTFKPSKKRASSAACITCSVARFRRCKVSGPIN